MKLKTSTKFVATALMIAAVAVPSVSAADVPAGQSAPGGDGRSMLADNRYGMPEGFDLRVAAQSVASVWPEGQPAPGGSGTSEPVVFSVPAGQPAPGGVGLDLGRRSTFPEGQPAPGGESPVGSPVSTFPEGQPAPGGRVATPVVNAYPTPVGFDFRVPANWVTDPGSSPFTIPSADGFDFTDAVIGAAVGLAAALLALGAALAVRRRGGFAHG